METYLLDWANLLLRWLHLITGIAWIGASFYFVMLDNSLRPPKKAADGERGVFGELWAVHGGGFYCSQKFLAGPKGEPLTEDLHWSKWEAYTTWLSGFGLFMLMYLLRADIYLVNPSSPWEWARNMNGTEAGILAVAFLVVGYNIYSRLCRIISPTVERDGLLSAAVGVMMVIVSWLTMQIFPGRAAFLITGALMATCMSANVFFWIIPGQRRMVKALKAGEKPNPLDGAWGKQRSVHNNYLTLPVVFLMLSNHYPLLFATKNNWLIVAIVLVVGPVIRHFFNARHEGKPSPWWTWFVAAFAMMLVLWLSTGGPMGGRSGALPETPKFAQVNEIAMSRCSMCHTAEPVWTGIGEAPKAVHLDTAEAIRLHAKLIALQAGHSSAMPPGNVTEMTPEERQVIAAWYAAGAPGE